jgi:hypothetical protein
MSGVVWELRSLAVDLAETDLTGYAAQLIGIADQLAAEETPEAWLEAGIKAGWVTEPCCITHGGFPLTVDEAGMDDDELMDCCVHAVRLT